MRPVRKLLHYNADNDSHENIAWRQLFIYTPRNTILNEMDFYLRNNPLYVMAESIIVEIANEIS